MTGHLPHSLAAYRRMRSDLNEIEVAEALRELQTRHEYSVQQLADVIGLDGIEVAADDQDLLGPPDGLLRREDRMTGPERLTLLDEDRLGTAPPRRHGLADLVGALVGGALIAGPGYAALGAGDAKFMRNATLASALVGFLPPIWLSLAFGWGLLGIWAGLTTFMVLRLVFVGWRAASGRWLVAGTG